MDSKKELYNQIEKLKKENKSLRDLLVQKEQKLNKTISKFEIEIAERLKTEASLVKSRERFKGIFKNAVIGIFRISSEGKLLMVNPRALKLIGANVFEEVADLTINDFYIDKKSKYTLIKSLFRYGKVTGFEARIKRIDGTFIDVIFNLRLIKVRNKKKKYIEGTLEDVTIKKEMERTIIEAKQKALQSDKLKSEFLAQVSHEIKTPIHGIITFLSFLKDEIKMNMEEGIDEAFENVLSNSFRLSKTIDSLLEVSKLESTGYSQSRSKVNIQDLISKIIHKNIDRIRSKNIEVIIDINSENKFVNADKSSLERIFTQLIDNATNFTEKGEIRIEMINENSSNVVKVIDTGIGIAEDKINEIFKPFTQEYQGIDRKYEGSGLGLNIVQKYCEICGYKIDVLSKKGIGSTFSLTFPK